MVMLHPLGALLTVSATRANSEFSHVDQLITGWDGRNATEGTALKNGNSNREGRCLSSHSSDVTAGRDRHWKPKSGHPGYVPLQAWQSRATGFNLNHSALAAAR